MNVSRLQLIKTIEDWIQDAIGEQEAAEELDLQLARYFAIGKKHAYHEILELLLEIKKNQIPFDLA